MSKYENPSRDREGAVPGACSVTEAQGGRPFPLAYLITFTCYGTRLHGNDTESVDRDHNIPGTPFLTPNPSRLVAEEKRMKERAYTLDNRRRAIVLDAIRTACNRKTWRLLAVHVRRDHIHAVVAAQDTPEAILNRFKSYASWALNRAGLDSGKGRRWTHHGSTRYLWSTQHVRAAIEYVVRGQGKPMSVWESGEPLPSKQ